jgi:dihydroorotase-like cyclic amidohydrolase
MITILFNIKIHESTLPRARKDLFTKNKITMFEGVKTKGMPIACFVRGTPVMKEGQVIGKAGHGRMI